MSVSPLTWTRNGTMIRPTFAEQAHDAGLSYYEQYAPIRQGLINMYAVGLYHLVEQQGFLFFRQVTPTSGTELKPQRDPKFKDVVDWLNKHDIFVARFQSWSMMEKLNLLSDCVKHAEGRACRQLLEKEPDWFTPIDPLGRAALCAAASFRPRHLSEREHVVESNGRGADLVDRAWQRV